MELPGSNTGLLALGASRKRVQQAQLAAAHPFVNAGRSFALFGNDDELTQRVAAFNAEHIDGPTYTDGLQGLAALEADGTLIGALTCGVSQRDAGPIEFLIRYVAVDPSVRGRGIGTLLLCILDQNFTLQGRRIFYGACAPETAPFYARAGFDVLHPGTPLPGTLFGQEEARANSNLSYPCWFVRTWSMQYR